MKRMINFTRGVRSVYVLPQKGGVIAVFMRQCQKYEVFKIKLND